MKLYITNDNKSIENFKTVQLKNFNEEVKEIVNNSCETIYADKVIDFMQGEDIPKFTGLLLSKLRMNGKIVFTGYELGIVCRGVINETIDSNTYSKIITRLNSMSFLKNILSMLTDYGLQIETAVIRGLEYEIAAVRNK